MLLVEKAPTCSNSMHQAEVSDNALFLMIQYHFFSIGQEDHFDILTEMMPVAGSWKAVGTGLRIDSGHLNMIQESNSDIGTYELSFYSFHTLL